jgi:hypothetical protein
MNRSLAMLVLAGFAGWMTHPSYGEEPPHLEFVRGLRAQRYPDLALDYLQQLGQNPPPGLAPLLPLERAKARVDLALLETDLGRRAALFAQAQNEFQTFLKESPGHPLAAEANVELAHVAALRGKMQLSRALRQDTAEQRQAEAHKARSRFAEAGSQLQAGIASLEAKLRAPEYQDPQTAQDRADQLALTRAKLKAELERGLNLLDQAQTYTEGHELLERAKVVQQAAGVLRDLAERDRTNPLCWQARAWLGRCFLEIDDRKGARLELDSVFKEPGEHAEAARRLAQYFRMLLLLKDPDAKNPLADLEREGQDWLRRYPGYVNTPEGYGVRFELAHAYHRQAQAIKNPQAGTARLLYDRARRLYQALEQTENDYTERAREAKLGILFTVSGGPKGDVGQLKTFEECYVRAQYEAWQIREEARRDPPDPKREEKVKERLQTVVAALSRGLSLPPDAKAPPTPPHELLDARQMLAYAHWASGDYRQAVRVGEELARQETRASRAAWAGIYALQAYGQLVAEGERQDAAREELDALRGRLYDLARHLEETWRDDPVADAARYQWGLSLLREHRPAEAVAVLARITRGYSGSTFSQYYLALAALQAHKEGLAPPDARPYQDRAVAALESLPEPPAGADAATVQVFLLAKLKLGEIYYAAKNYGQMEALAGPLLKRLDAATWKLPDAVQDELRAGLENVRAYATYGRAEADYQAGRYAQARAAVDPVAAQVKEPRLRRGMLALALRANVQEGNTQRAKEILEVLQQSTPSAEGLDDDTTGILVQLVAQLKDQVQDLRHKGDAFRDRLDRTVSSFAAFLDELAKQPAPAPEILTFLVDAYFSLDRPAQAAALLERLPEPKATAGAAEPDPKQVQAYRTSRILYVRALRQAGQFDKAREVLEGILGTPERPGWGQRYLDARKERVLLLQDTETYGGPNGAILEWNKLMISLRDKVQTEPKIKEHYFECYYHLTYSLYKHALKVPDEAKKREYLQQAAGFITKLESAQEPWGTEASKKRFLELLQKEPVLKEYYEELKKR